MAQEIERKFLVDTVKLAKLTGGKEIRQGFIPTSELTVVRVRISGDDAWLTIKGKNEGITRSEFEYVIPKLDAIDMLNELCLEPQVMKNRYCVEYCGYTWEIDVFLGDNKGLIVAEVELEHADDEITLPEWVTQEVTDDPKYYNVNLVRHPYKNWN
ncbi:CYTH domain-containing protein [Sessilibacter corallicola]|uniref:CYTH domain-containing protein n=1 Tax=Sessilibacter corallicola TaxID=2904075 RepID=A0ABQ0AC81_9GAMM